MAIRGIPFVGHGDAEWTQDLWRQRAATQRCLRTIEKLIVHCADTPAGRDIGAKEINDWHVTRGWLGIGYHFVIRLDGSVELGRPLDTIGSHVKGHNHDSLGICVVGGAEGKFTFLPAQLGALHDLLAALKKRFSLTDSDIYGHRHFDSGKLCPSFEVTRFITDYPVLDGLADDVKHA